MDGIEEIIFFDPLITIVRGSWRTANLIPVFAMAGLDLSPMRWTLDHHSMIGRLGLLSSNQKKRR